MYGLTGLALLAFSAVATAAPAVAAIPGNPGRPPKGYTWTVNDWEANCAAGVCGYTFTITAPAVQGTSSYPSFPALDYQCNGINNNYHVNCVPLGIDQATTVLTSHLVSRVNPKNRIFVRLELTDGIFAQQPAYYGKVQAPAYTVSLPGASFNITNIREAPRRRHGQNNPVTGFPFPGNP